MIYQKSATEIIQIRKSMRSYVNEKIAPQMMDKIKTTLAETHEGFMGNRVRFEIVERQVVEEDKKVKLGTYGFIKGVKYVVVGAVKKNEYCCEDYGYVFEKVILFLTDLGLGTCWIGGTFNRGEYAKAIKLEKNEVIPAISPFGYTTKNRSIRDRVIRMTAGSNKRKPWDELFFNDSFQEPLAMNEAGDYKKPIEMLRIGPSASNKQPWRIVKEKNKNNFHLFLKRTPGYDKMVSVVDLQRIDIGIGMSHFELTARELKLSGSWKIANPNIVVNGQIYVVSWIET